MHPGPQPARYLLASVMEYLNKDMVQKTHQQIQQLKVQKLIIALSKLDCLEVSIDWRLPESSAERPSVPSHSSTQLWHPQAQHTLTTRWVAVAGRPSIWYSPGMQPHSCICIQLPPGEQTGSGVHHVSPSTSAVTWFPSHICNQLAGEMVTLLP